MLQPRGYFYTHMHKFVYSCERAFVVKFLAGVLHLGLVLPQQVALRVQVTLQQFDLLLLLLDADLRKKQRN